MNWISGEKPFECDICQKRFTLKHSMVRHRRKHESPHGGAGGGGVESGGPGTPAAMSASDDENTVDGECHSVTSQQTVEAKQGATSEE